MLCLLTELLNTETMKDFNTEDYLKISELVQLCKEELVFTFDGLTILGNRVDIVKKFVSKNPGKKFRTWLEDTQIIINIPN